MTAPLARRRPVTVRVFSRRFAATPLGARLARRAAVNQLRIWGIPCGTDASDTAALLIAELASNAVTHGRVPGRDFALRLTLSESRLCAEVSDARGERRPPEPGGLVAPPSGAGGGRGLLLVEALADRWAVLDRAPAGKTVRAELDLPR
ncbi:MAG TPA: hypothetical protein DEQ61_18205 [Streptomyces sp.]|nr:hypothetical protein [Streptomyces sp.]